MKPVSGSGFEPETYRPLRATHSTAILGHKEQQTAVRCGVPWQRKDSMSVLSVHFRTVSPLCLLFTCWYVSTRPSCPACQLAAHYWYAVSICLLRISESTFTLSALVSGSKQTRTFSDVLNVTETKSTTAHRNRTTQGHALKYEDAYYVRPSKRKVSTLFMDRFFIPHR
jgi:hypothetical protein